MLLSGTLVQMIEDHWRQISGTAMDEIRGDPTIPHVRELPESELRDRLGEMCQHLGQWLVEKDLGQLARNHEALGKTCYERAIPPQEMIHAIHVCKHRMLNYVRDQGFAQTAVDLYAEEELEHRIGCFFECLVYYLIRGYWNASQKDEKSGARNFPESELFPGGRRFF